MNTLSILAAALVLTGTAPPVGDSVIDDSVWDLIDASVAAEDEDRSKELLEEAETRARSALLGHEDDVDRRYTLAVVLGLRTNIEGGQTKVRVASALNEELNTILALDPAHPGARHMLGRLHAGVRRMGRVTRWIATNLLGGNELKQATWEAAEENLAYAEEQAPEVPDHHLQLALLYRDTGRRELAIEELTHVMALQASTALEMKVHEEAMEVWAALAR
jgi:hypothetical protein